ncbi:DoxX family protein [Candidatus Woesearchaeota archaeon]|nr:DoxX family protein [Candidatus Woesearchaeota archaeon]MBI2582104.1 DoxX family protein [Candidatus Woesearchaeota archaeon]
MKLETKYKEHLYVVFRVGIGLLFLMFGLQKIFGLWGMPGGAAAFGTLIWVAGAAEILIGVAVAVGVLTRLASVFGVIEMAVAYVLGHALVGGWNPAVNMGAPALLFLLAFLVTFAYGAGKASLERKLLGKEMF